MVRPPFTLRGQDGLGLPPALGSGAEPPGGDYVRYVERLLAWSEAQQQLEAARPAARLAAPVVARSPMVSTAPSATPPGARPTAKAGARGQARRPEAVVVREVPADRRQRPVPLAWRAAMALAWLGLLGLLFFAPALLPLAVGLALVAWRLRGLWKKLRA